MNRIVPALSALLAATMLLLATGACQRARPAAEGASRPSQAAVAERPLADSATAAQRGYLTGFPARAEGDTGRVHALVEIPAGTSEKWMVSEDGERLIWERRSTGARRVVDYLAYPTNYGIVPRTAAGDGDPLDVLVLGPALPRGSVWSVRPIGVLRLTDDGATDDKILTVRARGPLSDVRTLDDLRASYPGVTAILRTWFTNYKGTAGDLQFGGYDSAREARAAIREAVADFEE